MLKLSQIAHTSLISTSRFPRWWILALVQVVTFSLIGELFRPHWMHHFFAYWLILAFIILIPATVWLWLDVEAVNLKLKTQVGAKVFIWQCLTAGAVMFCSLAIIVIVRLIYGTWVFLALISSLIAATAVLAMLYVVLCKQPFYKALLLAADTWNKKISLAAAVAFILIVANGFSFAFVHGVFRGFRAINDFSLLSQSATIWIILVLGIFLVAFIAAILNCFLVLLFLEIINRKKDPEILKETVKELAISQAN